MRHLSVSDTSIQGVKVIHRHLLKDHRGYLERLFCRDELGSLLEGRSIAQVNHTHTIEPGTIRGLHFQRPPYAEMKLITCLKGRVHDVALDLRQGSKTFMQWHAETLSDDNHRTLVVPEGVAHGFQTLAPECELVYLHTAIHNPETEGGFNALDAKLGIDWPMPVTEMSDRDRALPLLDAHFDGIRMPAGIPGAGGGWKR